eukprot:1981260-Amphidinium_carterae.1
MVQPKVLVEVLTEQSPTFACKIWERLPNWRSAVQASRGTPMHEGQQTPNQTPWQVPNCRST